MLIFIIFFLGVVVAVAIVTQWGISSFSGLIAGAILGSVIAVCSTLFFAKQQKKQNDEKLRREMNLNTTIIVLQLSRTLKILFDINNTVAVLLVGIISDRDWLSHLGNSNFSNEEKVVLLDWFSKLYQQEQLSKAQLLMYIDSRLKGGMRGHLAYDQVQQIFGPDKDRIEKIIRQHQELLSISDY